jgi:hypothetical protein
LPVLLREKTVNSVQRGGRGETHAIEPLLQPNRKTEGDRSSKERCVMSSSRGRQSGKRVRTVVEREKEMERRSLMVEESAVSTSRWLRSQRMNALVQFLPLSDTSLPVSPRRELPQPPKVGLDSCPLALLDCPLRSLAFPPFAVCASRGGGG